MECGLKVYRARVNGSPLVMILSWSILSGPCGSSGSTMMFVCMNRCAGRNERLIGAVSRVIGSSFSLISSTLTEGGIGPAPEDPVRVKWGGLYRDSFGSYRSLISRTRSAISAGSSARMKIPFSGKHYSRLEHERTSELNRKKHRIGLNRGFFTLYQRLIEVIPWVRVRVFHHLDADQRADGRASHHIARPMLVVEYAR